MPLSILSTTLAATALLAADPPEILPAPRQAPVQPPPYVGYYRPSRDRWQYYRPDYQGIPRPLVSFDAGYGYYYLYNGKPYYYAPLYQAGYRPSIAGTPYRSFPTLPPAYIINETRLVPQQPAPAQEPERMPYVED